MKVLVIGATGLIGANVCEALVRAGYAVRGMKRPSSDARNVSDLPVEWVEGDVRPGAAPGLARAMAGCSAVIHAAGAYTGHYRSPDRARYVARANAGNVKAACLESGVQRAVFVSSYATIAHPPAGEAANEGRPAGLPPAHHPRNPYVQMKVEMERVWLAPAGGLDVVVTIPMGVWGLRDSMKSTGPLIRAMMRREIPALLDGAVNILDSRDCGRAHVLALEKGRPGERYLLGGTDTTLGEIARKVAAIAGVKPTPVWPRGFIPPTVAVLERFGPALNGVMKRLPLAFFAFALAYSHPFDFSKARKELGFAPEFTLDDTLRAAVACVRQHESRAAGGAAAE